MFSTNENDEHHSRNKVTLMSKMNIWSSYFERINGYKKVDICNRNLEALDTL